MEGDLSFDNDFVNSIDWQAFGVESLEGDKELPPNSRSGSSALGEKSSNNAQHDSHDPCDLISAHGTDFNHATPWTPPTMTYAQGHNYMAGKSVNSLDAVKLGQQHATSPTTAPRTRSWKGVWNNMSQAHVERIRSSASPSTSQTSSMMGMYSPSADDLLERSAASGTSFPRSGSGVGDYSIYGSYRQPLDSDADGGAATEYSLGLDDTAGESLPGGFSTRTGVDWPPSGGLGDFSDTGTSYFGRASPSATRSRHYAEFEGDANRIVDSPLGHHRVQPRPTLKRSRQPRASKTTVATPRPVATATKLRRRIPKSTQQAAIDCSQLLVTSLAQARGEVIRRTPLKIPGGVDDATTAAANRDANILRIAAAFNQTIRAAPDTAHKCTAN
ncbi:hypothetical protein LTR95_008696 [Oleoguttula sp. CCFEE 5521]